MRKVSIVFTALIAVAILLVSWNKAQKVFAAIHINDFGCGLFDGDGGFVAASSSQTVITSSGNENLKCQVKDVANSTGKAVRYDFASTGLLCGTFTGVTDQWHETVSASGNATLQCKTRP